MNLHKIALVNYKNFNSVDFVFDKKINCFVGSNGVGKTNLLDAIYHLAFSKGYFNSITVQNIRHGADFFLIEGVFKKDEREELISCSFKKGQKKVVKRNGKAYDKLSEHIGLISAVMISPMDRDLIREGSEVRRKFVDSIISQYDKLYLQDLIAYNKVLSQRNSLLKYFALNHTFDALNLKIYNEQLVEYGTRIYNKRKLFLEGFIPLFKERYAYISDDKEAANLEYRSQLDEGPFEHLLEKYLEKDRVLQYTSVGIHKDDLLYTINGYQAKKYGSQGQQKSYLIALKLAQFDHVKQQSKQTPILLLDDIFDKLDELRVAKIIALVNDESFGQLFISDTHEERTEAIIKKTNQTYQMFVLNSESNVEAIK